MQVELFCPRCCCRFVADPETPALDVLERMAEHGPWYALGDGETFEDMIFNTMFSCGHIRCAQCGESAHVTEESLGQLTLEVLGHW
jgi:hypothetical protein